MSAMKALFYFSLMLMLSACATRKAPAPANPQWDKLWASVRLEGEGRARLEVPPESWVFSFEAVWKKPDWEMAIRIPLRGEETYQFPGLDRSGPEIVPAQEDFRWQIVQALREASERRRLAHPQLGQDFVVHLHHLLRWSHAAALGLARSCDAQSAVEWSCQWDGVPSSWSWNERKEEFTGIFVLRPKWQMRAIFRNLTDSIFKRLTVEIIRETGSEPVTELRQEFFFQ